MTADTAGHRARMWAAVDHLTRPTRQAVARDDGTTTWSSVPSLWVQACDVFASAGGVSARTNAFDRAPVDLALMTVRNQIAALTRDGLAERRAAPAHTVPAQIRQLAVIITTSEPDRIGAHADMCAGWVRQLTSHLAAERTVTAVRIRDSGCPRCGARQALVDTVDGPVVSSALVVDFHDGYVRAAVCGACDATWFRGAGIEQLAALLGCPEVA